MGVGGPNHCAMETCVVRVSRGTILWHTRRSELTKGKLLKKVCTTLRASGVGGKKSVRGGRNARYEDMLCYAGVLRW